MNKIEDNTMNYETLLAGVSEIRIPERRHHAL